MSQRIIYEVCVDCGRYLFEDDLHIVVADYTYRCVDCEKATLQEA